LEERVHCIAKEISPKIVVYGKSHLPNVGEYNEELVLEALSQITKKKYSMNLIAHKEEYKKLNIAKRMAVLCPGCPHRATYYAAKVATAGMDVIYCGDVGCYILGIYKPMETQDFVFSMGASEGVAHGIKKSTDQKAIAFLGDSTFFHAGMPGMVNTIFNKSNPLIIVLDNRITAMTGHQPNPGVGITAMGELTKAISIEEVVKAFGVENIKVIDPFAVKEMTDAIKEFLSKDKVSVIVAKRECQLLAMRKKKAEGVKVLKFEIDQTKCQQIGLCLNGLGCPAIYKENGKYKIDKDICTGCGVCAQVCPAKAIHAVSD
jgi:indolepyruvate ferredoxin oxidoreductase alpha subunit